MPTSKLKAALERLSMHSIESVQDGSELSIFDAYMHVERPIEQKLRSKMRQIEEEGGGIILLVGSAGDGKSHLISQMKREFAWDSSCYYNDATASCSPRKTAIDTLKDVLEDFQDANLYNTNRKLVLAINLGKLNALIDEEFVRDNFSQLVKAVLPIFDEDDSTPPIESNRIKVVLFTNEQIFEFYPEDDGIYPVKSTFLSSLLYKIVAPVEDNIIYQAYAEDVQNGLDAADPVRINYELLSLPEIRTTVEMTVIEAIIRSRLIITPREFLDFIHSILVPIVGQKRLTPLDCEALLPSLIYGGGKNMILNALSELDPLKHSSTEHDKELSVLFNAHAIPEGYFPISIAERLPLLMINRLNSLYDNNGHDTPRIAKFVYRLKHVLAYHSESEDYLCYLSLLRGVFKSSYSEMHDIYELVSKTLPRHCGSYYSKRDMIPLSIQGAKFRIFSSLKLEPEEIVAPFSLDNRTEFFLRFNLKWSTPGSQIILTMDYQLYSYLRDLNRGKLALAYENDKNLEFCNFVAELARMCDCRKELFIVCNDGEEMTLKETFRSIYLQ